MTRLRQLASSGEDDEAKEVDVFEVKWDEETEDAENDVAGIIVVGNN